jgi:peroxiredoxin
MKKDLINSLISLLIFVLPVIAIIISDLLTTKFLVGQFGLPESIGLILSFILVTLASYLSYTKFQNRLGFRGVTIPLSLFIALVIVLFLYLNTIKYTIKLSPFYLTIIMGLISGYYIAFKEHTKFKIPLILAVFPLLMSFGINDLWVQRIEYGNWTGTVAEEQVPAFELTNKAGEVVNNESLKGKIILLDFWFIGCRPCWVKFPDLQRIYEQYNSNPSVEIFAVNRSMEGDKPGALFSRIEEKGYSFPVLAGTEKMMDAFNIYKYPTVIIINQDGKLVFAGEIEDAEKNLGSLLESI